MAAPLEIGPVADRRAFALFTDRTHGDLRTDQDRADLDACQQALVALPWTWLRTEHASTIRTVTQPGEWAGERGDGAVTATPGAVLSVYAADCVLVALSTPSGVGAVHAGWRGLLDGALDVAVAQLRALGPGPARAWIGPAIGPCCYEFAGPERDAVADRLGAGVCGRTSWGTPALDLRAGARVVLGRHGVELAATSPACTGCDDRWYSHRRRAEIPRHALAVWIAP